MMWHRSSSCSTLPRLVFLLIVMSANRCPVAAFVIPQSSHTITPTIGTSSSSSYSDNSSYYRTKPFSNKRTDTALGVASGYLCARPIGVGSAAPQTRITNADLEAVVETSDEWIRTRTGISSRHVLTHEETLKDLSVRAARQAMTMAQVQPHEIDIVICASSSPDDIFGDAPRIASDLGCPTSTVAFDLTAACSGFLFAAVTAGKFLTASQKPMKALVVGADALSRWVDWDDRNVCILFGDGAGAMVLESTPRDDPAHAGLLGYVMRSDGAGSVHLNCNQNGNARQVNTPNGGIRLRQGEYSRMSMSGKDVYKFATREVPDVLEEVLKETNLSVDDIDWLLLHQANIRIMDVVAKRLGVPMEKVLTNLSEYGNTSAASIPLALDEAVRQGKVKHGDVIACAGFGAGLSWGATVFKWGGNHVVVADPSSGES